MSCPVCGRKQSEYTPETMTCPVGHHVARETKPPIHRRFEFVIPAVATATLAADLLVRTLT